METPYLFSAQAYHHLKKQYQLGSNPHFGKDHIIKSPQTKILQTERTRKSRYLSSPSGLRKDFWYSIHAEPSYDLHRAKQMIITFHQSRN